MKKVISAFLFLSTPVLALVLQVNAPCHAQQLAAVSHLPGEAIRPFHLHMPASALKDLRKRIRATRWPEQETVNDRSQGMQLQHLREAFADAVWELASAKR